MEHQPRRTPRAWKHPHPPKQQNKKTQEQEQKWMTKMEAQTMRQAARMEQE